MIILQKGNVQKIVASKNQADKLISVGFKVIEQDIPSEFICPVCQKPYKTEDGLQKHMTDKHPDEGGDSDGGNSDSNQNGAKTE